MKLAAKSRLVGIALAVVMAFALLMGGCASVGGSTNSQLKTAYATVDGYVELTKSSAARGRITPDEAAKASALAKSAMAKLDLARTALKGCGEATPCDGYVALMQQLQPILFELERQARLKEQAK